MYILDLFCGVGGLSTGFKNLGDVISANDMDSFCKKTYEANHPATPFKLCKIENLDINTIPDFDILLAGFPCQPFSIAGHREGFEDKKGRGNVFYTIADIIEQKQPEYFLLENVKNLKGHDNGNTFNTILNILSDLSYFVKYKILNSKDFGVPQNRERIYIVGFKDKTKCDKFEFPKEQQLTKSVFDLLEQNVDKKYYYEGKPLYDRIKNDIQPGKIYQWRRQYVRENKQNVCPTLTANMGTGGHNVPIIHDGKGIRKLTPRECFSLQGFPDSFILPNIMDSQLYKQAGNSVSIPVIEAISNNLKKSEIS